MTRWRDLAELSPRRVLPGIADPSELLVDAQQRFEDELEDGIDCPCCGRLGKIYRRPLGASMARWLIWLVRIWPGHGWIDIKDTDARGGDYAKLAHWQLVEQQPNADETKKDSGMWRPTPHGITFVYRRIMVPSHVYLLFNNVIGWEPNHIEITDALGKTFNYSELMQSVEVPE